MLSRKQRGFTLIELLVVIAIIALLASIILASFSQARAKARDSKRVQDLLQVQKALELYASNHNGKYPKDPVGGGGDTTGYSCWQCTSSQQRDPNFLNDIAQFLNPRPCDPTRANCSQFPENNKGMFYKVNGTCTQYKLALARTVEKPNNVPANLLNDFIDNDNGVTNDSIAVCSSKELCSSVSTNWQRITPVGNSFDGCD